MYANSIVQPHVYAGRTLVDVSPARCDKSHCQRANIRLSEPRCRFARSNRTHASESIASIDPEALRTVDKDVSHFGVADESGQRPEFYETLTTRPRGSRWQRMGNGSACRG